MDELPRDAKELLALARSADEPPTAARGRVRQAVALTLTASVATSAGHAGASSSAKSAALKTPFLSTLSGKLALVSSALVMLGAGAFVLSRTTAPSRPSESAVAPASPSLPNAAAYEARPAVDQPSERSAEPAAPETTVEDSAPPARVARAHKPQALAPSASDDGLRAEMTLLHDASAALDRGEVAQARSLLHAHRAQHANGQLREERQGLEVLARCMANDASAESSARAYLRSTPEGVLSARITSACIERSKP